MSPERRQRGRVPPDRTPQPDPEPSPWYRAARFAGEQPSERAYFQAQDTIYQNDCDLSAYRLLLEDIWHVAVLGGQPTITALQQELERTLYAEGEPTTLPDEILVYLFDRRAEQSTRGPWMEGHYRPGKTVKRRRRF